MGNDQKPCCSSWIAIEPQNFKTLEFLLYDCHTPQLENIDIPAIAFSPHFKENVKDEVDILPADKRRRFLQTDTIIFRCVARHTHITQNSKLLPTR